MRERFVLPAARAFEALCCRSLSFPATFLRVMGLAFSRQLCLVLLQALRDASLARLHTLAQGLYILHAGMSALRPRDLFATAAGKLVLVLRQATHNASLPRLHAFAQFLRIRLARFCEFVNALFRLGDGFTAPRREFRPVLFQAH